MSNIQYAAICSVRLSVCAMPITQNGAFWGCGYYRTLIATGNPSQEIEPTGSGKNGSEALAIVVSDSFARWLHHWHTPSDCRRRGHIISPYDTFLKMFFLSIFFYSTRPISHFPQLLVYHLVLTSKRHLLRKGNISWMAPPCAETNCTSVRQLFLQIKWLVHYWPEKK